ncbi:hypothetical protein RJ639_025988 [Escallonia herrerae]|nr:hypothetical protein RJ639_025988 [Escallonia herrerae]
MWYVRMLSISYGPCSISKLFSNHSEEDEMNSSMEEARLRVEMGEREAVGTYSSTVVEVKAMKEVGIYTRKEVVVMERVEGETCRCKERVAGVQGMVVVEIYRHREEEVKEMVVGGICVYRGEVVMVRVVVGTCRYKVATVMEMVVEGNYRHMEEEVMVKVVVVVETCKYKEEVVTGMVVGDIYRHREEEVKVKVKVVEGTYRHKVEVMVVVRICSHKVEVVVMREVVETCKCKAEAAMEMVVEGI